MGPGEHIYTLAFATVTDDNDGLYPLQIRPSAAVDIRWEAGVMIFWAVTFKLVLLSRLRPLSGFDDTVDSPGIKLNGITDTAGNSLLAGGNLE